MTKHFEKGGWSSRSHTAYRLCYRMGLYILVAHQVVHLFHVYGKQNRTYYTWFPNMIACELYLVKTGKVNHLACYYSVSCK